MFPRLQVLEPAPTSAEVPLTANATAGALPLSSIYLDDLTDDIEPEIAALYLRPGRPARLSESQNHHGPGPGHPGHHAHPFTSLVNINSEWPFPVFFSLKNQRKKR